MVIVCDCMAQQCVWIGERYALPPHCMLRATLGITGSPYCVYTLVRGHLDVGCMHTVRYTPTPLECSPNCVHT